MDTELRKLLERWRNCLQDDVLVKDDVERQIGIRALDSFELLAPGAKPSQGCLEALVEATRSSEAYVGCAASELLGLLAGNYETARETIRQLLQEENESARFWAISAAANWGQNLPTSFVEGILRTGLTDASMKVKMSAARHTMRLGIRTLLPDLMQMRRGVTGEDDCDLLDQYIALLRDGYSIEVVQTDNTAPFYQPMFSLCIRLDDGTLIGGLANQQEMDAKGPAKLAKEIGRRYLEDEAERQKQEASRAT